VEERMQHDDNFAEDEEENIIAADEDFDADDAAVTLEVSAETSRDAAPERRREGGADRPAHSYGGSSGYQQRRPRDNRRTGNRRLPRRLKKVCPFCQEGSKGIDYKRGDALQRFVTERGAIRSRRKVGTCAKHQRQLSLAIKRARHLALLPYTADHIRGV